MMRGSGATVIVGDDAAQRAIRGWEAWRERRGQDRCGTAGSGVLGLPETVTAGLFDLDAQLLDAGKGSVAR
jgi:hypothetical protein